MPLQVKSSFNKLIFKTLSACWLLSDKPMSLVCMQTKASLPNHVCSKLVLPNKFPNLSDQIFDSYSLCGEVSIHVNMHLQCHLLKWRIELMLLKLFQLPHFLDWFTFRYVRPNFCFLLIILHTEVLKLLRWQTKWNATDTCITVCNIMYIWLVLGNIITLSSTAIMIHMSPWIAVVYQNSRIFLHNRFF